MRAFNPKYIFEVIGKLIPFIPITLCIAILTVIFSIIYGFILFQWKKSDNFILSAFSNIYINLMRCTPTIVLLFVIYYGLPELLKVLFNWNINGFNKSFFVVLSLTLIFSANMAEIIRSAYVSIDKGQLEAALSIGLTKFQAYYRILIPEMVVIAIPNFGNSFIILLKEGALCYTIGLIDVMGQGNLIVSRNFGAYALETYIGLAIIYWVLTILFQQLFSAIELKLDKKMVK